MPQLSGVSRLRLSPGEVERLLKEEKEKRRKLRIVQVREKARLVAKSRLEAVKNEKVKQLEKLAEKIEEEWEVERQIRIAQLEREYSESLKTVGTAHIQAEDLDLGLERKAVTVQENNKRAEERYKAAIAKLHEDRQVEEAESEAVIQARELAMAKERLRAREVASMPPSMKPDLKKLLSKTKAAWVQLTDADTYTYPYQLPADEQLVERNEDSFRDGMVGAEEENVRRDDYQREHNSANYERLEKARVRGAHALKRERMRQDYNSMMRELDLLEKADRKHRQQNLEHIPQSLYLPAHVVADREADRQTQMERKVEEVFADKLDPTDLRANAPPLNYDTTPTVTETSSGTPSGILPRAPVTKVRDGESARVRVPLQNLTNTSSTTGTESTGVETGSEKKRKVVLKQIMKKIDKQKEEWVAGEDLVDEPTITSPTRVETRVSQEVTSEDKEGEETASGSLSQVPDVSSSEQSGQPLSQVRVTSNEGDTTTSSEFIERQRQELVDYMKSLESQIGNLEALKKDKEALEKEEDLAARLEAKLAQGIDSTGDLSSELPAVSQRDTLEQTRSTSSDERVQGSSVQQDAMLYGSDTTRHSPLYRPEGPPDSLERRSDESTWEWYLRQKASLGESIKQKLHKITSTERGYRLQSPVQPSFLSPASSLAPRAASLAPPASSLAPPASSLAQPASALPPPATSLPPPVLTRPERSVPAEMLADYREAADREATPPPVGYVPVSQREALARGDTLPEPSYGTTGYKLHGDSILADSIAEPPPSVDYLSVEERERLLGVSSILTADGNENLSYNSKRPDQLHRDLHEHSQRLARLQQLMSSTRSAQLTQSENRPDILTQSGYRPDILTQSGYRDDPVTQSGYRAVPLTQSGNRPVPLTQSENTPDSTTQSMFRSDPLTQSGMKFNQLPQSDLQSHLDQSGSSSVHSAQPATKPAHLSQLARDSTDQPAVTTGAQSYISVEERESLIRTVSNRLLSRDDREALANKTKPTWHEVLASQPSRLDPADSSQQQRLGVTQSTPYSSAALIEGSQASGSTVSTGLSGGRATPLSSISTQGAGLTTGWSAVHQQMLTRQAEFNRKQDELRRQLADIQEQKRKLLAPSSQQELHNTQDSLRQTLERLGIDLDGDDAMQSTPIDRRVRPPVTFQPFSTDLDPHELSVIQEVDTPTHLTSYDESTLLNSLNNVNGKIRHSRSMDGSHTLTPTITLSDRSGSETVNSGGQSKDDDRHTSTQEVSAASQNTSSTSGEGLPPGVPHLTGSRESDTSGSSVDSDRVQVLNQLLQQLESRRAQRQSFLEKEKLTTLMDESASRPSPDLVERSPRITDLYSSDSAEEVVGRLPLSSDTAGSTPSGDKLTEQLQGINREWIETPVQVTENVARGLTSSESSTPSSEQLRCLYATNLGSGAGSDHSTSNNSPRVENVEALLQTVTSKSSGDGQVRSAHITSSNSSDISSPSSSAPRGVQPTPTSSVSPKIEHLQQMLQAISQSQQAEISSDNHTLSQGSEHTSPNSRTAELTQATDPSLAYSIQDEMPVTLGTGDTTSNSGSAETSMKTLTADVDETLFTFGADEFGEGIHGADVQRADEHAADVHGAGVDGADVAGFQTSIDASTPMKVLMNRPTSSTPNKQERVSGPMEEPEITFASTVADDTLVEEPEADYVAAGEDVDKTVGEEEDVQSVVPRLQWVDEQTDSAESNPPNVRPKTKTKNVDSAARKKQQKEMTERTKRLYSQLEEVKERKAYKAKEERKVDVQARRKEYGNKLLSRSKKS